LERGDIAPRPFWTFRRVLGGAALLLVVLTLAWGAVVLAVAVNASRRETAGVDAIVVLGAAQYNGRPSPVFRARLDHAGALYLRGLAPIVLVTGGVGPGDTLSEAIVGERYLREIGLPVDAVVSLASAASTYGSLRAVARWFGEQESRRALFVSDGFHMLRLRIIANRLGLVPYTSPAPGSPIHANARRNLTYMLTEGVKVPIAWVFHR
jgi:uncharacterized SAM-binding protein YcdF (DUF218 family)